MGNCNPILFLISLFVVQGCSNKTSVEKNEGFLTSRDGTKIHYLVKGSDPDTILVIHGGPGAGINSFRPSVEELEESFTMIYYDQRGGGLSGLPEDTSHLAPDYYLDDLEVVREHFGIQKMNVIAHSFGSVLMAEYARKYPDNIKSMVYHGATAPVLEQELRLRREKAESDTVRIDPELLRRSGELLSDLLEGRSENPVSDCREYEKTNRIIAEMKGEYIRYKGSTCDMSAEAVAYYYEHTAQKAPSYYAPWNYSDKLSEANAPVLVLWGAEDSVMIPAQESWARAYPEGRLLLVPGSGKASFSANPEFTFRAVSEFFSGSWPVGTINYDQ